MSREPGFGTERVEVRPRSGSSFAGCKRPSRKGLTRSLADEPLLALEAAVAPEISGPARGSPDGGFRKGAAAAGACEIAPRRVGPAEPSTEGRQLPPACDGAACGFGRPPPELRGPPGPPPGREESAGAAGAGGRSAGPSGSSRSCRCTRTRPLVGTRRAPSRS
eukprot:5025726-Alexandrium_andersonii.AAC.1